MPIYNFSIDSTNTTVSASHNVIINTFPPFWQTTIELVIGFIPIIIMLYIFFKTDFFENLFDKMYEGIGKPKYTSEYACRCPRCQFELRTKKGLKRWKKTHRFKKEDGI